MTSVADARSPESVKAPSEAARKRAAVELIRHHERTLQRTARRYSLCADDAEDAFQRSFEILLTKAPTTDQRDLIRWMQTVTKHEALAVRKHRERLLGQPQSGGDPEIEQDWVQLIPSQSDGPADRAERHERVVRSREALGTLKPHELRALTLLAEGYSYVEIGEITGWSHTKINRLLAEGRQRFRSVVARSEEGDRCDELSGLMSAFCDGEAAQSEISRLQDHLRACAHCRSKLRAYRAAPRAAAALMPTFPLARSLTERLQEAWIGLQSRLPGGAGGGDSVVSHAAMTGGSRGAGSAVLAKVLTACIGTAGGAAACVATGVVPSPIDFGGREDSQRPVAERTVDESVTPPIETPVVEPVLTVPNEPVADPPAPEPPGPEPDPAPPPIPEEAPEPAPAAPPPSTEFTPEATAPPPPPPAPPPAPSASPAPSSAAAGGGSGAGEFGP